MNELSRQMSRKAESAFKLSPVMECRGFCREARGEETVNHPALLTDKELEYPLMETRPYGEVIRDAQFKKLVEWLNEECQEEGHSIGFKRHLCFECMDALKEAVK